MITPNEIKMAEAAADDLISDLRPLPADFQDRERAAQNGFAGSGDVKEIPAVGALASRVAGAPGPLKSEGGSPKAEPMSAAQHNAFPKGRWP